MAKAICIKTDGTNFEVKPKYGENFDLKELQDIVQGYIELVRITRHAVMVVNEEGVLKGLPKNELASIIAGQPIVGDVLLCELKRIR